MSPQRLKEILETTPKEQEIYEKIQDLKKQIKHYEAELYEVNK